MKLIVYLLLFYMYYFMMAGFIWLIAPNYEFGEITSCPPVIIFAGVLSVMFAWYSVLDLKEKGKL